MAPDIARALVAAGLDYLVVVRGSIYSADKTRPDFHEPTGFNIDVCRRVRAAVSPTPVLLQGSVVDWGQAERAIGDDVCDGVEMTRAQIADPDMVSKLTADRAETIRPCIRCNQTCQVRDARNPIVSCVGEPSAGRDAGPRLVRADDRAARRDRGRCRRRRAEAACAAMRGHRVAVFERASHVGGMAAVAGPQALVAWLAAECRRLGVEITTNARSIPRATSRSSAPDRNRAASTKSRTLRWSSTSPTFAAVPRCGRQDRAVRSDRWATPSRWPRIWAIEHPHHTGPHRRKRVIANR